MENDQVKRSKLCPQKDVLSNQFSVTPGKCKLLDLPKEIISSVLTWIPQLDKVRSRLISKDWKQNVDSHATFNVKVNALMPPEVLKRILELRINSIEFSSLQTDFELNLAYPLLVKEIIISTNVSPNNFKRICETCRDVTILRVLCTFNSDRTFAPEKREDSLKILRNLKRLKEIEIGIFTISGRRLGECETFNVIFANNLPLPFGNLSKLTITLQLYHSEMYTFFEFLVKQSVTLQQLSVRLDCPRNNNAAESNMNVKITEAPWYTKLKNLKLKSLKVMRDPANCLFCNEETVQVWKYILQNQDSLTCLAIDLNKDFTTTELVNVLWQNPNLESLKVYGLHSEIGDDFQESTFENTKLVELFLEFTGNKYFIISGGDVTQYQIEFKALQKLPLTLKKLTLKKCVVPHDLLLSGLARLRNLQELCLEDCLCRNEHIELDDFLQVFQIFSSSDNDCERFTFDGFDFPPGESSREGGGGGKEGGKNPQKIIWNNIIQIAKSLGILKHSERGFYTSFDPTCRVLGNRDYYDFKFNKHQIREFITKVQISAHDG